MRWRWLIPVSAALIVSFLGCRKEAPQRETRSAAMREDTSAAITVEKLDEEGLTKLLKERHGRVLFLNVWATWCVPCVEEFPDLVRLHHAFVDKPVDVVGVSADFDDEVETKIVPFLRKHNVPFRVYVSSFKRQDDFINDIEKSWSGALPASLIITPNGKRTFFLVGKGTFAQFKKEVDKALGGL